MPPAQPTPALPPAQIPAPPQAQQHAPPRPSAGAAPDFYDDMDMDLLDEGDAEAEAVLREREESEAARPPQHAPPRQAPRPAQPAPGQPFQAPPRPVFQKKAPMQARAAADDEFDAELLIDAEQRALAARTLAARPPQLPAVAPPRRDQRFTTPDDSDDDDVFKTPALPLVKSSTVERSSHQVAAPPSTSHPLRPTATAPMQRADAPISASVSAATPVVAVSRFFGMPQTISPPQLPPQLPPQASHAPAATVPHVAHVTPPAAPVLHQRKPLSLSLKGPTSASMPVVAPVSQVAPGQPVQSLGPPSRSASAALPGVCETIDVSSGSSSDDDDDDMLQSIRKVGTPLITVCPIKPFSFLEELQARTPTPSEIGMKFRCSVRACHVWHFMYSSLLVECMRCVQAFALGLDWFSTNKEGYEAGATLEGCGEAAGRTVQAAIQPDYVQSIINVPPLEFKAMLKRSAEVRRWFLL